MPLYTVSSVPEPTTMASGAAARTAATSAAGDTGAATTVVAPASVTSASDPREWRVGS